uniref:Peroxisomal membrane protein 11C n=1 Tax=Strigamia maritima TaxID=126957 RepID=T1ISQ4_STRMM
MELLDHILKTHSGRDKGLRLINYSCLLLSSAIRNRKLSSKFVTIANEVSQCRTTLRLFDDLIMLRYSLAYGLGKEEPDLVLKWIGVINNIVDQIYYPVEHVAWAADKKLINIHSKSWWNACTILWGISLYLGIIRAFRYLRIQQQKRRKCLTLSEKENIYELFEILTIIQNCFDLCNAIHWLPKGFLWSQQLQQWQVGLFGVMSSVIILYKYLQTTK